MRDTVAIIGSHPRTRAEFDFSRTDCDIWLFNEAISGKIEWAKRADAVFQMHAEAIWRNPGNRNDPGHCHWLQTQTEIPVYMQEQYPDVPACVRYPLEEIVERFGARYFTSSVAYALALACYQGYKRVELYGVEMETNTEYGHQRPGVAFWLGLARGLGMEVDARISLFDSPLYGYDGEVTMPYEHFETRVTQLQPHIDKLSAEYKAAFLDLQKAFETFVADGSKRAEDALFAAADRQRAVSQELGELSGRMQETQRYKAKADTMRQATGGEYIFSRQEFESAAADTKKTADVKNLEFVSLGTKLGIIHQNMKRAAKGSKKHRQFADTYRQHIQAYLQAANLSAVYVGASKENYDIMGWLDAHIQAAGGAKSEAAILEQMSQIQMAA